MPDRSPQAPAPAREGSTMRPGTGAMSCPRRGPGPKTRTLGCRTGACAFPPPSVVDLNVLVAVPRAPGAKPGRDELVDLAVEHALRVARAVADRKSTVCTPVP